MNICEQISLISPEHPDADILAQYRQLVDGLVMYSEAEQPYDVFLWDVVQHGGLLNEFADFNFIAVVKKIHGQKIPIRKSNLLQEKHRQFFEFDGDKLVNKKPLKFYRDKYIAWNRFVGRIYTDNGILDNQEIIRMRALAKQIWTLESNTVRVFEFDSPTIQQYVMGKTEHGNWLGIHTLSVET